MNLKKRILAVLTIICCLAGAILPEVVVRATEADGTTNQNQGVEVVFENAERNAPSLTITKHIDGMTDEDASRLNETFTFVLKLNGKLAKEEEYLVIDCYGQQVENKVSNVKVPFTTDRSGMFTLKAGQTAMFEYVGAGVHYEITEVEKDNWIQIQPAGGLAAVGTVPADGAWVEFTNMKTISPSQEWTDLEIYKTISFPEGYQAPKTPAFKFEIKLRGEAYGLENYTVVDIATGAQVGGIATTTENGTFTLEAGQKAVFTELPLRADYEVREVIVGGAATGSEGAEDWRPTGETVYEGTTGEGSVIPLVFNNVNASFAVTKTMEDNSKPDKTFRFLLTKADRSVWPGAEYYLYNVDGTPVKDDQDKNVEGQTDANGYFELKPGQTAVFYGIPSGTVYSVSEQKDPGYTQIVPKSAEGYKDKVVLDSVETLLFTNKPAETGLTVTKTVTTPDGEVPGTAAEFTFVISKVETEGGTNTSTPIQGAFYVVEQGTNQYTYKTDEKGQFTLKANQTAIFTRLSEGKYRVEELEDLVLSEYTYEGDRIEGKAVQEKDITAEVPNPAFEFKNAYNVTYVDLYLYKKNTKTSNPLAGAEFKLYYDKKAETSPVEGPKLVTGEDGTIQINDLKVGSYYLKEVAAPTGYQLLEKPIELSVGWKNGELQVRVDGKDIVSTDDKDQIYIKKATNAGENNQIHITIYNNKAFLLASTGGAGVTVFLMIGLTGIAVVSVIMLKKRQRKDS